MGGRIKSSLASLENPFELTRVESPQWKLLGANGYSEEAPTRPGLYQLREGQRERWVSLAIPSEESDTRELDADIWDQMGAPLTEVQNVALATAEKEKRQRLKNAVELEGQQSLWKWLIIATIVLLILESLAAIYTGRRREAIAA